MAKRTIEPLLWMLFSAGGVLAALFLPILLLLFGLAFPLGWLAPPRHEQLLAVLGHPLTRLVLFFVCTLALIHGAHRFRYTLLRRLTNQAPERGHQRALLRRSHCRVRGGGISPLVGMSAADPARP